MRLTERDQARRLEGARTSGRSGSDFSSEVADDTVPSETEMRR